MKKTLSNLFGQQKAPAPQPEGTKPQAQPAPSVAAKKNEFLGKRTGFAIAIFFPEYAELAPFLSGESRDKFLADFGKAIDNALRGLVHSVEVSETGLATVAVDESAKQSSNHLVSVIDELYKEMRLWVGTFGRTGIPALKYGMGVARGEIIIDVTHPKISGLALSDSLEIAQKFCPEFDLRLGVSGDIVRASTEAPNWIDFDDWCFEDGQRKAARLYSKFADRQDPIDIQMVRSARKAYFMQNWDDAAAKFDRLTLLPTYRHIANLYIARVQLLRHRPKVEHWDGVYRG
jgi:hypothetical protein